MTCITRGGLRWHMEEFSLRVGSDLGAVLNETRGGGVHGANGGGDCGGRGFR